MEAVDLLRDQAAMADNLMTQVFAKVTPELAAWRLEGSTANPIASTFLHVYLSKDRLVQTAQGKPTIFESGGWEERLDSTGPTSGRQGFASIRTRVAHTRLKRMPLPEASSPALNRTCWSVRSSFRLAARRCSPVSPSCLSSIRLPT